MAYNLLKGKKGLIFGALNEQSIAWKVAERTVEEGAEIVLTNTAVSIRMGTIGRLAEKCNTIVVPADAAAGSAWGLFGVLKGATVRNLTIGEGSSVVSTAAAMTAVGAVAGYAYEATIENCENRAAIDIQGGGDNVRESAGGIVGAICANENDSHILSCTNYGKITSKNSVNTKNGATGFSIGGIVGCIVPALPGVVLSYAGLLCAYFTSYSSMSPAAIWLWLAITVAVSVADYFLPAWMTRRFGGSRSGAIGATVGVFAGFFFFPPVGIILGPFFGAVLGELLNDRRDAGKAFLVGIGSFLSFVVGTGIKLAAAIGMFVHVTADTYPAVRDWFATLF